VSGEQLFRWENPHPFGRMRLRLYGSKQSSKGRIAASGEFVACRPRWEKRNKKLRKKFGSQIPLKARKWLNFMGLF
jgi:hypothetical protein